MSLQATSLVSERGVTCLVLQVMAVLHVTCQSIYAFMNTLTSTADVPSKRYCHAPWVHTALKPTRCLHSDRHVTHRRFFADNAVLGDFLCAGREAPGFGHQEARAFTRKTMKQN
jgi:hypothetical protein